MRRQTQDLIPWSGFEMAPKVANLEGGLVRGGRSTRYGLLGNRAFRKHSSVHRSNIQCCSTWKALQAICVQGIGDLGVRLNLSFLPPSVESP